MCFNLLVLIEEGGTAFILLNALFLLNKVEQPLFKFTIFL